MVLKIENGQEIIPYKPKAVSEGSIKGRSVEWVKKNAPYGLFTGLFVGLVISGSGALFGKQNGLRVIGGSLISVTSGHALVHYYLLDEENKA